MRQTYTFDRVDRMSDILYGVAVARGLIEYERLGHRVSMRSDHMTHLLISGGMLQVCRRGRPDVDSPVRLDTH